MSMVKVLVVDDHQMVRHGLVQIIGNATNLVAPATAADGAEALQILEAQSIDVVLLDISLPGRDGLDVLKEIKSRWAGLPVIMLTMHPEKQFAVRAIKNGASGYLTKDTSPDELLLAIRTVSLGTKYITPAVANQLADSLASDSQGPPHERLTDREFQVLVLTAQGKSLKEIGAQLCLSGKTVSTYRTRIQRKLSIDGTTAIVRYALEHALA